MRARPRPLVAILVSLFVGCLALHPSPSFAQSDATRDASARAFFEEGVAFAEHSEWENAEDRFRRAYSLRTSPIIGYNLASTLHERRKLIEASELLRKLSQEPGLDPELARSIDALAAEIAPRIARLTVRVEAVGNSDMVQLDATPLLEAQLGVAIPVDPGAHHLVLTRAGRELDAQDVELADAGTAEVTLHASKAVLPAQVAAQAGALEVSAPGSAPSTTTKADAAATRDDGGGITRRWWFWTGIGAVVVATVVTVAIVSSSSGGGTATAKDGFHGDFNPPTLGVMVR